MLQQKLIICSIALFSILSFGCFDSHKISSRPETMNTNDVTTRPSFFSFTTNSLEGEPVSLEKYRGKKIIVLNVASKCGFTPQYADWEKYYEAHKDKVVILGFPCNDFMSQEPGSAKDIAEFCTKNYGVSFPMFDKVHVKGSEKAPVYAWLTDPAQNGWNSQEPSWNFCKYLINEKGELIKFFASDIKPDNAEFVKAMGM